jgi:hypothetical protein
MIVKGSSRGGASQLGPYLLSTAKNERAVLLELKSPVNDLTQSLEDWQTLADGTQQGKKGLYHAQIAPHGRYEMTLEQWMRCVDLLEQALGLTGQPRAVVLHEKDGKEHLHVVWQRTDLETMKFISDSQNYAAHERVSQILEQEFGHEPVPGKHAKREQKPVDEQTRARDLQMKETVTRLYQQSDSAQAFKTALEEEGYILAKGDRRPHIVVDADGKEHSLYRCLPDLTPKEIRAFMAPIDRNTLPTAEEAKALQSEAAKTPAQDQEPPPPQQQPEPPKPETPQPAPPEPPPAQQQTEPPKPPPVQQQPDVKRLEELHMPKPAPSPSAEQFAKLETALKNRHDLETHKLVQQQQTEKKRLMQDLNRIKEERIFELKALHKDSLDRYDREHAPKPGHLAAIAAAFRAWWNPAQEENRTRERAAFYTAQRQQLDQQIKDLKIPGYKVEAALAARHTQQRADHQLRFEQDRARYLREESTAVQHLAEIERQRQLDKLTPKPTPPPDLSL